MSSNIRAVVYENALRVVERAAPQAEPGEALIRLRLAPKHLRLGLRRRVRELPPERQARLPRRLRSSAGG